MVNKLIGYLIAIIGLAGLVIASVPKLIPFTLPSIISGKYLIIGSIIIIILGVFLSLGKKSDKQPKEVPIYEGQGKNRKIVGYQRN